MFEVFMIPDWSVHLIWFLPAVFFLGTLIWAVKTQMSTSIGFSLVFASTIMSGLLGLSLGIMLSMFYPAIETDNPNNIADSWKVTKVQVNDVELRNFIAEHIEADNVMLHNFSENHTEILEQLIDGETIGFIATTDQVENTGKFYFTEDTMIITLIEEEIISETKVELIK